MSADVPETVACPCGEGFAERRPEVIRERVSNSGTTDKRLQLTHVYRHDGCPIGGHIVTVSGYIETKVGPLFHAGPRKIYKMTGVARPEVVADGGEPP